MILFCPPSSGNLDPTRWVASFLSFSFVWGRFVRPWCSFFQENRESSFSWYCLAGTSFSSVTSCWIPIVRMQNLLTKSYLISNVKNRRSLGILILLTSILRCVKKCQPSFV
jgi:hypothetical protein